MANQPEKFHYFVFIVYPDSAPEDWRQRLRDSHGMFAVSPLHCPDSEVTKDHYHVIYKHENSIRLAYAQRILVPLGVAANGYIEPCPRPGGYQRYLLHLDDGEKQQFVGNPYELIWTCNGFPLCLDREYTIADRREQRSRVFKLIRDNGILEYSQLLDGLLDAGEFDLFDFASGHTILLCHYLASRRGVARMFSEAADDDNGSYVK